MYQLHGFCQSGNTFKVALALQLLQQPWESVFVDFMHGATRQAAWREAHNEMGEAPVLTFQDSDNAMQRLAQSGLILMVLAERHADALPSLAGRNAAERHEVLRWILFDNHKFTANLATYRFLKSFGPAAPDPAVMAFLKGRIDAAAAIVDQHLAQTPFMVGEHLTIADLSLCGYLFYPEEEFGLQLMTRFPAIGAWVSRLKVLPGFKDPYLLLPGDRIAPKW